MPVSYLSKPAQDNPYVLPVDIGLLAKVNQYKQSIFYQNADKVGQELNQLNNTDILKDNERNYLKDKVNNLTTSLNDMGGLDYSDMNVANTIDNYAANIYKDPVLLTAITSTQAVRKYMSNLDAMKNDPKLSKYYDPAREWYDTQNSLNPNSIINYKNSKFGEGYNGPTAPAIYLGNDFDLLASTVKNINPNIIETFGPSGQRGYIDKQTGEEVTPEQIRSMVDGHIDGKVADQLKVHAAYNYYGLTNGTYSKQDGISEYVNNAQTLLDQANKRIETLKHDISTTADNDLRDKFQKQLDYIQGTKDQPGLIDTYTQVLNKGTKDFSKLWDQSPESAMYLLYKNKLTNDVVGAYSYSQTKHQLILDQEYANNNKILLEAAKQGKVVKWNADGTYKFEDPLADPNNTSALNNLTVNTEATDQLNKDKVTQQSLIDKNNQVQQELSNDLYNLVYTTAQHANIPGLVDYNKTQIANDPTAKPVVHPNILKNIAMLTGDNQLTPEDIKAALQANNNLQVLGMGAALTPEQVKFFQNVLSVLDEATNGKDITGRIKDASKWKQFAHKYSIEKNYIDNNTNLINSAHQQVLAGHGADLTTEEKNALDLYNQNPSKYYKEEVRMHESFGSTDRPVQVTIPVFNGPEVMKRALNKIGGPQAINNKMDELLNKTATRNNYYNILFNDEKTDVNKQYPQLKNYMVQELTKNENPDKQIDLKKVSFDDLHPTAVVTDGQDYYIAYNNAKDLSAGTGYVKIEPQSVAALKIPVLPYPHLEQVVSQYGKLLHPLYIDPTATQNKFNIDNNFKGPVKIQIHSMTPTGSSLNANVYEPSIVYNGDNYYYTAGSSSTANAALQKITLLLQNNQTFTSLQDLLNTLDKVSNQ